VTEVLRLAAFSSDPRGGNPAGVVLDATGLSQEQMLRIAAEVGYSETAFLVKDRGSVYDVRYFSPLAEVPFCGHATIAAGVALGPGEWLFRTASGAVPVSVATENERVTATLTSVPPTVSPVNPGDLEEAMACLGWGFADLDPDLPPRVAFAGVYHLVLAARERDRLARLDYQVDRLRDLMQARDWTTVDLVWRQTLGLFHARNPFPVGGAYEDPATGAAAAALGAYLRELDVVGSAAHLTVLQGEDMGRPSELFVRLEQSDPRVRVSGTAVRIEEDA